MTALANLQAHVSPAAQKPAPNNAGTGASVNFSGQYLYDRFVENDQGEVTKLDIVRQACAALSIEDFKKCLSAMVKIPKDKLTEAEKQAKDAGVDIEHESTPEIVKWKAKYKTAQNHQSVMRVAFGALKLVPDVLESLGVNGKTGYREMKSLADTALQSRSLKWDGTKVLDEATRDLRKKQSDEMKVLGDLRKNNPMAAGETIKTWNDRIMSMYDEAYTSHMQEKEEKEIIDTAKGIIKTHGALASDIASAIFELLKPAEDAGTTEPAKQA